MNEQTGREMRIEDAECDVEPIGREEDAYKAWPTAHEILASTGPVCARCGATLVVLVAPPVGAQAAAWLRGDLPAMSGSAWLLCPHGCGYGVRLDLSSAAVCLRREDKPTLREQVASGIWCRACRGKVLRDIWKGAKECKP